MRNYVLERIDQLRNQRGWSIYKLAEESGITQSTLANMYARDSFPSINSLQSICDAFGMTISQFFDDGGRDLNVEEQLFLANFKKLSPRDKSMIQDIINSMLKK